MTIKARDLRVAIKDMGFDQGVVHTLELALEDLSETKQYVRELADLVSTCIHQVELMVKFGDAAKTMIEELQRKADQEGADD